MALRGQVNLGNHHCWVIKKINEPVVADQAVVVVLNRMIEVSNREEGMEDRILVGVHVVTTPEVVKILIAEMVVDLRVGTPKDHSIALPATSIIVPRDL